MVFDVNNGVRAEEIIVDPVDDMRQKKALRETFRHTASSGLRERARSSSSEDRSAMLARERVQLGLDALDETQFRMLNPHTYPVGLEFGLNARRRELVARLPRHQQIDWRRRGRKMRAASATLGR